MVKPNDIKEAANPFAQLCKKSHKVIEQNIKIIEQNEIKITLLSRLCELKEKQQEGDDSFRSTWLRSSIKKFYISLVSIFITGAVLWLDILELNPDSKIVKAINTMIDYMLY